MHIEASPGGDDPHTSRHVLATAAICVRPAIAAAAIVTTRVAVPDGFTLVLAPADAPLRHGGELVVANEMTVDGRFVVRPAAVSVEPVAAPRDRLDVIRDTIHARDLRGLITNLRHVEDALDAAGVLRGERAIRRDIKRLVAAGEVDARERVGYRPAGSRTPWPR